MAIADFGQLVLNVRPHPTYEDGDVLCAFTSCHIQHVHIQHICRPRDIKGKHQIGLLPANTLIEYYLARTSEYKLERVSRHEMKRTTIASGFSEIISNIPNAKGQATHLVDYFARQDKEGKIPLFGTRGKEVWYYGSTTVEQPTLDVIWDEVEGKTLYRRANHEHWPLMSAEKRDYLGISVDDFTNTEANELVSPLLADSIGDEPPEKIKERKNRINWRDLTGVVSADVIDADKLVDVRADHKHVRRDIVEAKARA